MGHVSGFGMKAASKAGVRNQPRSAAKPRSAARSAAKSASKPKTTGKAKAAAPEPASKTRTASRPRRSGGGNVARGPDAFPSVQAYTAAIHSRLAAKYGPARCPLDYRQPHELAIAVILSAQCTDEQVNRTTPELFRRFRTPEEFAAAPRAEIEDLIYSTGFYKNKARSIQEFCRRLVSEHAGVIPRTVTELAKLPGVGRKTANVVTQELYGTSEGVVVDTHVTRIARLLQLTNQSDAVRIERDLMEAIDRSLWSDWSLYVIFLGRSFCTARRRDCPGCPLSDVCPAAEVAG